MVQPKETKAKPMQKYVWTINSAHLNAVEKLFIYPYHSFSGNPPYWRNTLKELSNFFKDHIPCRLGL